MAHRAPGCGRARTTARGAGRDPMAGPRPGRGPPSTATAAKAARYNRRVFLAPLWDEIFTQDSERKQTRAEAEATCAVMRETYTAHGYQITELPRADIATRADFVCAQLAI